MIINSPESNIDMKAPPVPEKTRDGPQTAAETFPPPPPYSPPVAGPSHPRPPQHPAHSSTPTSVLRPQNAQAVNLFEVFSKHDTISGTYLVDPFMHVPGMDASMSKKLRRKRDKAWGKGSPKTTINASFQTRHGALNLDLCAITQNPDIPQSMPGPRTPVRIVASSNHGRVNVNLHEVHTGLSLDLHVETRHGNIVVLLPPTFHGPIVFNPRRAGAVNFLPAFASRTRTLRASDRETLVFCSAPESQSPYAPAKPQPKDMGDDDSDRCLIRTRHGKIVVGISGLDRVEEPSVGGGLFKAIGKLFETHGRAFGQYCETQAKQLERTMTQRSEMIAQYVDARAEQGKRLVQ